MLESVSHSRYGTDRKPARWTDNNSHRMTMSEEQDNNQNMAQQQQQQSFVTKATRIAAVVATYWFVSISLVFLNKYLLSSKDLQLDAPLFVTWCQCVISVLLCFILGHLSKMFPHVITFPEFSINITILKQVLPLSIVFVAMISSNNLCLKYVGVAFYYVVRSLTTVFNVILTYVVLRKTTSCKAIACCGVIIAGFGLGVNQESLTGSLSVFGVIFGVAASLFVALNAIYTKKVLPCVDDNVWRLSLYNNLNASLLFIPLMVLAGEWKTVTTFPKLFDTTFLTVMVIGGVFGFAIGYVTGLQIQVTSPLTHNISGTAKACAQTVIATAYYQESKDALWWLSNGVVLLGSLAYTHVQAMDMRKGGGGGSGGGEAKKDLIMDAQQLNDKYAGPDVGPLKA